MRNTPFLPLVIVLAIVIAAIGVWSYFRTASVEPTPTPTPVVDEVVQDPRIMVTSPTMNATVASPLVVTGEAVGPWYFEASFPVKLIDANNVEIASGVAQAQGEWMTEDFVPFTATLTFTAPTTSTGTLVLERDNPSGEPANAASISIPVQFAP